MRFPRRIYVLCTLSGVSSLAYTVLVVSSYDWPPLRAWTEYSRPAVDVANSWTLTRTELFSREAASALGEKLEPMIHAYGFSWMIGLSFFVLLLLTSLVGLRDYYVAVSLPAYSKDKPLLDYTASKMIGIIGCWAAASAGGELQNLYARTIFAFVFIPLTFYFVVAFVASVLARFRFQRPKASESSLQ